MNFTKKVSALFEKNNLVSILYYFFFLLLMIILTLVFGLEHYNVFLVLFLSALSVVFFVEPFWGLVTMLVMTIGVEGKIVEEFILFRLFNFNWYLTDFVFLLVVLSIFPRVLSGAYKIYINNISIWVLSFLAVSILSIYWGMRMGHSLSSIFHDVRGFFPYIWFLLTFWVVRDEKKLNILFIVFLVIGSLKCFIDINLSLFYLKKTFDAASGNVLNFSRLTGYSEIVYPIVLIASITYFLIEKSFLIRIYLVPTILLSMSALFLSYTRGSWLAFFLTLIILLAVLFYMEGKKIKILNIIYFLGSILFMIVALNATGIFPLEDFLIRLTSISPSKIDVSNLGRLVEWATAFEAFVKNPLFGGGFGLMYTYIAPGIGYKSTTFTHNSYLYVLSKMGIVGFIPFLMILFANLKVFLKIVKHKTFDSKQEKIIFTFLVVLLLISIKSFTTWHLNTWTFSAFVGMIFGISYIHKTRNKLD